MKSNMEGGAWIQGVDKVAKASGMNLSFRGTDVKKPLIAVRRITEQGSRVSFGLEREYTFVENELAGDELSLRPHGQGSYLMDVQFVGGENRDYGGQWGGRERLSLGMRRTVPGGAPERVMRFRNACGGPIQHYGRGDVVVASPF